MNCEILKVFDSFVTALETDDEMILQKILDRTVSLKSSFLDPAEGRDEVIRAMKWKGAQMDIRKLRVFNNVIRSNDREAYQSAYFTLLFGKESRGYMDLMTGAIEQAIHYVRREDGWKIDRIKCMLTSEYGNTSFVSGWWQLPDYSKYLGGKPVIDGHKDSPWMAMPEADDKNDKELIHELFRRYNWDIDNDVFEDLYSITSKDFDCTSWGLAGTDEWAKHLEWKRKRTTVISGRELPREAFWNHISSFTDLSISGDTASARIIRYEPNRLQNKFLHRYNMDIIYYPFTWTMDFIKEEDGWKFKSIAMENAKDGMDILPADLQKRYF